VSTCEGRRSDAGAQRALRLLAHQAHRVTGQRRRVVENAQRPECRRHRASSPALAALHLQLRISGMSMPCFSTQAS
jgi:hypothetical protein